MSVWNLPSCYSEVATVTCLLLLPPLQATAGEVAPRVPWLFPSDFTLFLHQASASIRPLAESSQPEWMQHSQTQCASPNANDHLGASAGGAGTAPWPCKRGEAGQVRLLAGSAAARGQPQPTSLQRPARAWEQRAAMAVLSFLSAGETTELQVLTRPGRPQVGKREHAGIFLFAVKRGCWLSGCFSVCLMGSVHQHSGLQLCGLGLWRLWAYFVSSKLFLSDFQVNSRQVLTPLSCYSLPRKLSELWNFSFYFLPSRPCLRRQQVPLVGAVSSRHKTGKWRRGIFTSRNPVWQDKDVWVCERDCGRQLCATRTRRRGSPWDWRRSFLWREGAG